MVDIVEKGSNIITYERKIKRMSRPKRRGKRTNSGNESQVNSKGISRGKELSDFFKNNIAAVVVGVIVLWIGWIIHDLPGSIVELEKSTSNIETRLDMLEGNYTILNGQIWSINRENLNAEGFIKEDEAVILLASSEFSAGMIKGQLSEKDEDFFLNIENVKNETVIGINVQNNEEVTKESVENIPFIIQYEENGEEVFFFGKYNENGQWDGNCVINCYQDSKLTFIMDAIYNNGKLEKYRQVFRGKNFRNQEIWYVSNREVEGEKNSGETTTYFFYGDCEKDFSIETIQEMDILGVDSFLATIPSTIEGYYSGYTSDGKYNDGSGNAYLVKYKTDGDVRYLYKGKIKNGVPNDDTGEAWILIWGDANDGFHYYKGKFVNGEPQNKPKSWIYPVEQEFINSIINPNDYACPLTGLVD